MIRTATGATFEIPVEALDTDLCPYFYFRREFNPESDEIDFSDPCSSELQQTHDEHVKVVADFLNLRVADTEHVLKEMLALQAVTAFDPSLYFKGKHLDYWKLVEPIALSDVHALDRLCLYLGLDELRQLLEMRLAFYVKELRVSGGLKDQLDVFRPFVERSVKTFELE